jgi:uncharacterized protein
MSSRKLLVDDPVLIGEIAATASRIAVLGIKPDTHADQPAHYVPKYLIDHGIAIVPVPVYYPGVQEILGVPVVRSLTDVGPPIDIVCVFRRSEDIDDHVDEMITLAPQTVWFQQGIRNDEAAARLADAGIQVVQDRCLMVEHRRATN